MDAIRKIADAVLYEGYILWPYRRSAMKNQQRWTFGGVYPAPYSKARGEDDPWWMQSQTLLEADDHATVEVQVRFLHVIERTVARKSGSDLEPVDELEVGGQRYLSWDEAREREALSPALALRSLGSRRRVEIDIPADSETEWLSEPGGELAGALTRSWSAIRGVVEVGAERLGPRLFRVTVRVVNETPWDGTSREDALKRTLASTHAILRAEGGAFVSLEDPPEDFREAVEACSNVGTWPVLAGEQGERHTMLASPIIVGDYPQVAPESPGDLFDGGEIDQLLVLNILSLTDEEKREMRDSDPRAREILERTESLSPEELMQLHGTMREFRVLRGE